MIQMSFLTTSVVKKSGRVDRREKARLLSEGHYRVPRLAQIGSTPLVEAPGEGRLVPSGMGSAAVAAAANSVLEQRGKNWSLAAK